MTSLKSTDNFLMHAVTVKYLLNFYQKQQFFDLYAIYCKHNSYNTFHKKLNIQKDYTLVERALKMPRNQQRQRENNYPLVSYAV